MGKKPGILQRIKDWFTKKPSWPQTLINPNDKRWLIHNDPNLIRPRTIKDLLGNDPYALTPEQIELVRRNFP